MKTTLFASVIFVMAIFMACKTQSNTSESKQNTNHLAEDTSEINWFSIDSALAITGFADKYKELKQNYILDEYSGMVSSSILYENGTTSQASTESFVIRNEAEYTSFVGRIYPYVLSKTEPQVENNDRLRKKPGIDFSQHMLIVLVRNDNPLAEIQLSNINLATDPVIAIVRQKALTDAAKYSAYPLGYGAYSAYLVKRQDKEFQFIVVME